MGGGGGRKDMKLFNFTTIMFVVEIGVVFVPCF